MLGVLCDCCALVDCYCYVVVDIRFVIVVARALILVKLFWMVARVLIYGWFLAHCYVVARVFKWLLGGGLLT